MNPSNPEMSTPQRVDQDLRAAADDADALLQRTERGGSDPQLEALRERLTAQLQRVREQCGEVQERTTQRAREAVLQADRAVQGHPYAAIGIAAAVGAAIGLLAARRR